MSKRRTAILLAILLAGGLLLVSPAIVRHVRERGATDTESDGERTAAASRRGTPGRADSTPGAETDSDRDADDSTRPARERTARRNGALPSPAEVLESSNAKRPTRAVNLRWSVGDAWVVQVWLRQMQQPRDGWSREPVRFRYQVKALTVFEGVECFEVVVDMLSSTGEAVADFRAETFYVDRAGYTLVGLSRMSREKGEWVPRTYKFTAAAGEGSFARYTSVPFDLPPSGATGKVVPAGDAFTVLTVSDPGAPRPDPKTWVGAGGSYTSIAIASPDGTIRQLWSSDDALWPAESVSNKSRSYRIK